MTCGWLRVIKRADFVMEMAKRVFCRFESSLSAETLPIAQPYLALAAIRAEGVRLAAVSPAASRLWMTPQPSTRPHQYVFHPTSRYYVRGRSVISVQQSLISFELKSRQSCADAVAFYRARSCLPCSSRARWRRPSAKPLAAQASVTSVPISIASAGLATIASSAALTQPPAASPPR